MYLKELSEIRGVSGNEVRVVTFLKEMIKELPVKPDSIKEDHLGNLMCLRKGKDSTKTAVLMAHTDEVGLMVTRIEEDGRLLARPLGGVDTRVMLGKRVLIGDDDIPAVISYKAIHNQKDPLKSPPRWSDIKIDTGLGDKKTVEKRIQIGDTISFDTRFEEYDNRYVGKAFDDRAGCSMLLRMMHEMKETPEHNIVFAFVVQEETGLRGSGMVLKHFHPDAVLVIEGTTAGDNPELKEARWSTHLDNGPAVNYLQGGYAIDRRLFEVVLQTARENKIPFQLKGRTVGSTDTSRTARSFYGAPGAVVNVPSRYIHSPVSVMSKTDFENTYKLARAVINNKNFVRVSYDPKTRGA